MTGVYTVAGFAGLVAGTPIGGLLAREYGITAPFWFGFVGSAVLVIVSGASSRRSPTRRSDGRDPSWPWISVFRMRQFVEIVVASAPSGARDGRAGAGRRELYPSARCRPRTPTPWPSAPGYHPAHAQTTRAPPLIHARGLTKRFGEFTAVDGIDFDVAPGESFGFLGPNGAGKTSTMRMIACVSPVDRRARSGSWAWTPRRRPADPRPPGRGAPAGHARHGADGPGEPRHLRPLLRPDAGESGSRPRSCSSSRSSPSARTTRSSRCRAA